MHMQKYADNVMYNNEKGTNYICVIQQTFMENDNFSLEDGHVIPVIIHRCYTQRKRMKILL